MRAGEGYRYGIGVAVLSLDALLFVAGHILLYTRRNYQPIKSWNPALMSFLLWCLIPSMLWVPYREVRGDDAWTAGVVLWLIIIAGAVTAVALMLPSRRLVLLARYERSKIDYYSHGTVPLSAVVPPPSLTQYLKEGVLYCTPIMVWTAIFLAYDTSADWSNRHFSYWNYCIIPWGLSLVQVNICGVFLLRSLKAESVVDAWDIRTSMQIATAYSNIFRLVWIILNVALPDINNEYFDSGYLNHGSAIVSVIQLVIVPSIKTFYTVQQSQPVGKRYIPAPRRHPLALKAAAANGAAAAGLGSKRVKAATSAATAAAALNAAAAATPAAAASGQTTAGDSSSPDAGGDTLSPMIDTRKLSLAAAAAAAAPEVSRTIAISRAPISVIGIMSRIENTPLARLMSDNAGYAAFLRYCSSEFSAENALFYHTVTTDFHPNPTPKIARRIASTFIGTKAPLAVNLPFEVTENILEIIHSLPHPPSHAPETDSKSRTGPHGTLFPAPAAAGLVHTHTVGTRTYVAGVGAVPTTSSRAPLTVRKPSLIVVRPNAATAAGGGGGSGASPPVAPVSAVVAVTPLLAAAGDSPIQATAAVAASDGGLPANFASLFDDALREVFTLLETDSFARFVKKRVAIPFRSFWMSGGSSGAAASPKSGASGGQSGAVTPFRPNLLTSPDAVLAASGVVSAPRVSGSSTHSRVPAAVATGTGTGSSSTPLTGHASPSPPSIGTPLQLQPAAAPAVVVAPAVGAGTGAGASQPFHAFEVAVSPPSPTL